MIDASYTSVVTFAGMGGSTTGLINAGFKELYALDCERHCVDIIKTNYPSIPNVVEASIEDVKGKDILDAIGLEEGELFLYQTSPPCRAFSLLNNNKDKNLDPRNELFKNAYEHVEVLKPKVVVLENVVSMSNHPFALDMIYDLTRLGYRVRDFKYWSGEYGSAQNRPRIFIVGYRNDLGKYPSEISDRYIASPPRTVSEICPDVEYIYTQGYGAIKTIGVNSPMMTITATPSFLFCKKVDAFEREMLKARKVLVRFEHDNKVFDNFNEFNDTVYVKPTVEELLLLSDFPTDYDMCADRITEHVKCWNRIGDVVVPAMMEVLGRHIIDEVG